MAENTSPFDILEITPWAELEVVNAAYRALARKYHPDMNPGVPPQELNEKMAQINWAKEQLEKDLEGWRKRVEEVPAKGRRSNAAYSKEHPNTAATRTNSQVEQKIFGIVSVEPPVLILQGSKGSSDQFRAYADGQSPSVIRARFKQGTINVQRLSPSGGWAIFGVTVTEDFPSDVPDNAIEPVDVVAPGFLGGKVFVTIAPISRTVLAQEYGGRIAPPRHVAVDARISFGKHRRRPFKEIAVEEPGYLEWMLREGAGSRVERACARLALDDLRGRTTLNARETQRRQAIKEPASTRQPAALPDPERPGGLLGVLKRLLSPR